MLPFLLLMRNKYQQRIQHYSGKARYGYFLTAALHYRHSNNGYNYIRAKENGKR
jgi:hypothetical protein